MFFLQLILKVCPKSNSLKTGRKFKARLISNYGVGFIYTIPKSADIHARTFNPKGVGTTYTLIK